jgi:DNA-binding CsgD family transcriptional regulator
VALFADRARQVDARFALDGQTSPAVGRLVARLDGMPLAIELAAARVEALGVTQLLDRLDDRFALLTTGDRLAPDRQRSLAATVEWSYRLLAEDERRVFRAVSVFPGPFTLEAVEAGDLAAAEPVCAAALARSRDAGDLWNQVALLAMMVTLDLEAGRLEDAAAHLREALQLDTRTGDWNETANALDRCGLLCAATGRFAEAVTVWAAHAALMRHQEISDWPLDVRRRQGPLRQVRSALGPARIRAAEDRGAAMSLATAAEYALLLTDPAGSPQPAEPGPGKLSARERQLVTLVAQGRTDAQIAAELYISIRTVRSHLDRIRDKTGCRRRADLTRLALSTELI